MNNIDNLKSYANVEELSRFTEESFVEYCKLKLETCKEDVEFIYFTEHISGEGRKEEKG